MSLIKLEQIKKTFYINQKELPILRGIDLTVEQGEMLAIVGTSGSGKSTLMNIIGCMDRPTSGTYFLKGRDVAALDDDQLSALRNESIGFVFQQFHLISYATAYENVILPTTYSDKKIKNLKQKAVSLLESIGMGHRLYSKPSQLSGGEQQRVAIARALMNEPEIILADEPTGALDSVTAGEIIEIFRQLSRLGKTVIIVTHDGNIASSCERVIKISDGIII